MGHVGDSRAYLYREQRDQPAHQRPHVRAEPDRRGPDHRGGRPGPPAPQPDPARPSTASTTSTPTCSPSSSAAATGSCSAATAPSGSLDDGRLADILSTGSPDFAAVELVRASLEAGSTDNVTCIVADVVRRRRRRRAAAPPMVVGSAAELQAQAPRAARRFFRGHRAGDTGELEPVAAEIPDDLPPASRSRSTPTPRPPRYAPAAPAPLRRGSGAAWPLLGLVGLAWMAGAAAWSWSQHQYYVGEQDGVVTIFRGVQRRPARASTSPTPTRPPTSSVDQPRLLRRPRPSSPASAPAAWTSAERTVAATSPPTSARHRRG